ncbi:TIGR00266 family protein [Halosimplex rubrum]|uniref:TIGR00266 family protein n=1 Tax=Halosimplex rubrum TaxID=869889 RepID=A0A7D5SSB2_9EURY|nr:TIGR00266 family protein [Halosimplex rubrum]QLH79427.1 TIGR00266 family protein [Halosimplex rubrum]
MRYTIDKRPSYAVLELELAEGEEIETKPGAMMTQSAGIENETSIGGDDGVMGMAKRAMSDERGLIENTYYATADDAEVTLVPDHPGDITAINVSERGPIRSQSGSLLAWEPLVERSTELNNTSNLFSSGELTVLGISGQGMAFVSSYGSMYEVDVEPGEPLTVDEDHLVAWSEGLSMSRQRDGSIKSTMLGGEGYVTEFSGEGHVWLQTRNPLTLMAGGTAHEDDDDAGGPSVDDFI